MRIGMLAALAAVAALGASQAQAQSLNSCTGYVDSPFQGGHTAVENYDGVLWPPNHKLRTIRISAENSQAQPCNVTITDVTQDEPLTGLGSGNTSPDAEGCDNSGNTSRIDLRGERSGMGTGRFYHVTYTMDDPAAPGMPKADEADVLVPHDQGVAHLGTWVDEGPLFKSYETATLACK